MSGHSVWPVVLLLAALRPTAAPQQFEFFEKQIRPLLAERCWSCHSSKVASPFAGLRLDSRAAILKGSDSGAVIVPGQPDQSRLIRAVRGDLPTAMPPTGKLKEEEIAALEKWIETGAAWPEETPGPAGKAEAEPFNIEKRKQEHWVWQPVRKPALPAVKDQLWPIQPVDRFVLARLERRGLKPAVPAGRAALARRLSLDLTGLPPSPEEVAAFERDASPSAYEKLVDRLLASPRFGEHWARHWMDLVRYSESHGSEGDPDTPMAWRYRDYLIRALNADVPYDQLIREHLAGDLLPEPRVNPTDRINESLLGLAHLRMVEHGFQPVDPWEDRVKWTDNQVEVFSKAFQGLTISCARCHDHKFDAISQRDFYALFGVFAGARPTQLAIDLPEDLNRNREGLERTKGGIQLELAEAWRNAAEAFAGRLDEVSFLIEAEDAACDPESPLYPWFQLRDKKGEAFRELWGGIAAAWRKEIADRRAFNEAHYQKVWDLGGSDYDAWVRHGTGLPDRPSPPGEFVIEPNGDRIVNGIYPAGVFTHLVSRKHNGVLSSPRFRISTDSVSVRMLGGNLSFAQLIIENYAVPRAGIYNLRHNGKRDTMDWVRWDTSFWKGFTAYVEFATVDDVTHFLLDEEENRRKPKPEPAGDGRSWFGAQAVVFHSSSEPPKEVVLPTLHLFQCKPGSVEELAQCYSRLLAGAVDAWREGRLSEEQASFLDYFVRRGLLPNSLSQLEKLRGPVAEYRRLEEEIPVARRAPGVVEESAPDQPLLIRGNHKNPGEPVSRRYLSALHSEAYTDRETVRLRLAEEVASPDNPLTARVMANRLWHWLFGRGIVRSTDNFGKLGDRPTHPELLDWLAARFVEDGWSIKKVIRLLVTSQTYRMSGEVSDHARRADPANDLFHHRPVRRLEAEAIRDAILVVSGQLDLTMYGSSVNTYYAHDTGKTKGDRAKGPLDGNGRRSVYLEIRRNVTNPFLDAFDVPKPATTRGQRDLTNVPAQALAMMNSEFVIDQAAKWADVLAKDGSSSEAARVEAMFLRALGRKPAPEEMDSTLTLIADLRAEYQLDAGRGMSDARLWRDIAQAVFNLKEFIYVR